MNNQREKFLEIIDKYNFPKLNETDEIIGKTINYVIDDYDVHVIVFTDNTCYFLSTNEYSSGIGVEYDYSDLYTERNDDVFTTFYNIYPDASKEWSDFLNELRRQDNEKKREYRYNEYLKLKAEFEGGK